MSCNGCRVLRKGCSESCILRTSLQWIESPEGQGYATLFVAKFFGRADLMSFISAVPHHQRPALFQSLLFEACGRTVNPVNGAVGLLWSGHWHICQAAVQTILSGGVLRPIPNELLTRVLTAQRPNNNHSHHQLNFSHFPRQQQLQPQTDENYSSISPVAYPFRSEDPSSDSRVHVVDHSQAAADNYSMQQHQRNGSAGSTFPADFHLSLMADNEHRSEAMTMKRKIRESTPLEDSDVSGTTNGFEDDDQATTLMGTVPGQSRKLLNLFI